MHIVLARDAHPRRAKRRARAQKLVNLPDVNLARAAEPGAVEPGRGVLLHRRGVRRPRPPAFGGERLVAPQAHAPVGGRVLGAVPVASGFRKRSRRRPERERRRRRRRRAEPPVAPAEAVRLAMRRRGRGSERKEVRRAGGKPAAAFAAVARRAAGKPGAASGRAVHGGEWRECLSFVVAVEREQHVRELADELLDAELGVQVVQAHVAAVQASERFLRAVGRRRHPARAILGAGLLRQERILVEAPRRRLRRRRDLPARRARAL